MHDRPGDADQRIVQALQAVEFDDARADAVTLLVGGAEETRPGETLQVPMGGREFFGSLTAGYE